MSALKFGVFSKQAPLSFIPEASFEDQNKALNSQGFFNCVKMSCRMKESHCLSFQEKALNASAFNLNREGCLNCSQGKKIAAKHNMVLKGKSKNKLQTKQAATRIIEAMV